MKYSYQLPVSSYTRYTQYTPTNYTPTPTNYTVTNYTSTYTPTHYTPTHYTTTHYTTAQYTPKKYTSTNYTSPSLYTPSHRTTSTYSSSYSKGTRYSSAAAQRTVPPSAPTPAAAKPVRAVHFPNDIIFQDCIRRGELELIGRFIRAKKVRLDAVFLSGMAAIHEAVLSGNLECVTLLVKYGADVHQRDQDGWTALHMACSDGYPDIARYLLSLGASVEAENESGEKPVDLIDPDCTELAQLFQTGCV